MSLIDTNIWAALEGEEIAPESIVARYAALDLTTRLYCALDRERKRHLIIPLLLTDGELSDDTSRGLTIQTRELSIGGSVERCLDIECSDRAGHEAFDYIGSHLAQLLGEGESDAISLVSRVLSRWRRFWGQAPNDVLGREAVIGLLGELFFLSRWLLPRMGSSAVSTWRGPFGARHDFERAASAERSPDAIEVKTTTSTRGRIHVINGIEQLLPPEGGSLYLFSLRLREDAAANDSLPTIIADCIGQLSASPSELFLFEAALAEAGYSPLRAADYEKMRFRIEEQALFEVRDDFPRIIPQSFAAELSSNVEKIQYVVNLNSYNHLRVAVRPEESVLNL